MNSISILFSTLLIFVSSLALADVCDEFQYVSLQKTCRDSMKANPNALEDAFRACEGFQVKDHQEKCLEVIKYSPNVTASQIIKCQNLIYPNEVNINGCFNYICPTRNLLGNCTTTDEAPRKHQVAVQQAQPQGYWIEAGCGYTDQRNLGLYFKAQGASAYCLIPETCYQVYSTYVEANGGAEAMRDSAFLSKVPSGFIKSGPQEAVCLASKGKCPPLSKCMAPDPTFIEKWVTVEGADTGETPAATGKTRSTK